RRATCTAGAGCNGTPYATLASWTVNANVTPLVSIAANPGSTICAGTSVTFTATPVNGGTTPAYQWPKNAVHVGSNSATYTAHSLANGVTIGCVLTTTAGAGCNGTPYATLASWTVNANVTPLVSIAANPGSTICAGTSVTFTATPVNGGTTPAY